MGSDGFVTKISIPIRTSENRVAGDATKWPSLLEEGDSSILQVRQTEEPITQKGVLNRQPK